MFELEMENLSKIYIPIFSVLMGEKKTLGDQN